MKWILLVMIMTGDIHRVEVIEFPTKEECFAARDWVIKKEGRRVHSPPAQCFRVKP